MFHRPFGFGGAPSALPRQGNAHGFRLPIYLLQSDTVPLQLYLTLMKNKWQKGARFDLKINRGKVLVLPCKQQLIGQKAGPSVKGALGGHPGQLGKIIAFR